MKIEKYFVITLTHLFLSTLLGCNENNCNDLFVNKKLIPQTEKVYKERKNYDNNQLLRGSSQRFDSLERLVLSGGNLSNFLSNLLEKNKAQNLKYITIKNYELNSDIFIKLSELGRLNSLSLINCRFDQEWLKYLYSSKLKSLNIKECSPIKYGSILLPKHVDSINYYKIKKFCDHLLRNLNQLSNIGILDIRIDKVPFKDLCNILSILNNKIVSSIKFSFTDNCLDFSHELNPVDYILDNLPKNLNLTKKHLQKLSFSLVPVSYRLFDFIGIFDNLECLSLSFSDGPIGNLPATM
jgi:hypothetical protein